MQHLDLLPDSAGKDARYDLLIAQLRELARYESDPIAVMANFAAAIHATFPNLWTGFYRVAGDELVLGPFQGPLACTRIRRGRGVCGTAWAERRTIVVDDVEKFPGHIACSSLSRSEIVVPFAGPDGEIAGVLDIDSSSLSAYDSTDARRLEEAVALLAPLL